MVGFFLTSYFLIKNQMFIKGETSRKIPVIIADGYMVTRHSTLEKDPMLVLEEAGIKVYSEDKITTNLITNPSLEAGVGQKISVERAPHFYILVDDKEVVVRSWDQRVDSILKKSGVVLGPRDIISFPIESRVAPGESITITRINVVEEKKEKSVDFQTIEKPDYYLASGRKVIEVNGSFGLTNQIFKVTLKNGIEVNRVLLSEESVKKPVNKVVRVGRMPSGERYFNQAYWRYMVEAGLKYGVDPRDLFTVAACESRVNPNSVSGLKNGYRYWGLYQYQSSGSSYSGGLFSTTAAKLGFNSFGWNDAKAQIYVTAYIVSKESGWKRWGCKP